MQFKDLKVGDQFQSKSWSGNWSQPFLKTRKFYDSINGLSMEAAQVTPDYVSFLDVPPETEVREPVEQLQPHRGRRVHANLNLNNIVVEMQPVGDVAAAEARLRNEAQAAINAMAEEQIRRNVMNPPNVVVNNDNIILEWQNNVAPHPIPDDEPEIDEDEDEEEDGEEDDDGFDENDDGWLDDPDEDDWDDGEDEGDDDEDLDEDE